ncbi:hypothetical protein WAI453_007845 [Rhynchosporium graminicola]
MSSQTEQPLSPNNIGFNDAPTLLAAQSSLSASKSKSESEKVAEVNIGSERRKSVVREVEVEVSPDEDVGGEGQKAMREGREVI